MAWHALPEMSDEVLNLRQKSLIIKRKKFIDNNTLFSSPGLKLLGVTLDDKLNYDEHIRDTCNKTSRKIGVLVRLRKIIHMKAKLQL